MWIKTLNDSCPLKVPEWKQNAHASLPTEQNNGPLRMLIVIQAIHTF